jgi:hypothetical protein
MSKSQAETREGGFLSRGNSRHGDLEFHRHFEK